VLEMNKTIYGILAASLLAIILASSALAISIGYMTRTDSAAFSETTAVSLGQSFTWHVGEVVDVQGNLYVYSGLEINFQTSGTYFVHLHFARWQNGWVQLRYFFDIAVANLGGLSTPARIALHPYLLRFQFFYADRLNATFSES